MLDVELAKSIKVVCIKPPPDEYESFMYLWTCLDTGKMYLGIHKVNKRVYWHSSTSKEFNNAVANPDSNYKYEVIDYGMHGEMATKEFNMLTEVDARNNDKWWNKSDTQAAIDKFCKCYCRRPKNLDKELRKLKFKE